MFNIQPESDVIRVQHVTCTVFSVFLLLQVLFTISKEKLINSWKYGLSVIILDVLQVCSVHCKGVASDNCERFTFLSEHQGFFPTDNHCFLAVL